VRIFGIDPGSERTGYGCLESDGRRHRLVLCGALAAPPRSTFPEKLLAIHRGLAGLLVRTQPDCVAIENLFHARNVRSALILGHARGVAVLAAVEAGLPVAEYTPAEVKRAVVGYGRAEKRQVWARHRRRSTRPTRWRWPSVISTGWARRQPRSRPRPAPPAAGGRCGPIRLRP
jgi:crossover junction endodeoxyribonuclease RuvC